MCLTLPQSCLNCYCSDCVSGFQAHGDPDVLEVQMPGEEKKKQRNAKTFVPSLNPISVAATDENGRSKSEPQISAEEQLYS